MRQNLFFVLLSFFLLRSPEVMAQACGLQVEGIVRDGETNTPFPGVAIFVKELNKGTLTDAKGHFHMPDLCPEMNYTFVYSALGYKSYTSRYHLHDTIREKIVLHTDTCTLESVTIFGKRPEEYASLVRSTLSGKELDQSRGLSLGDALKQLPGVALFKTGNAISKPVIHGLHSNRIVVLNAGLRQEGQQWGNEHAPEIDPFVSDQLTVLKGAAGVRYGSDAIGGVILVEPRALPQQKGIKGEWNLVGMSNNLMGNSALFLEGKISEKFPLSWRLQGSLKKAGNTKTPGYYQANTGFEEQNFSYALHYGRKWYSADLFYSQFNTTLGIFAGSHMGSLKDLELAIARTQPQVTSGFSYEIGRPFQHVEHELARVRFSAALRSAGKLLLQVGRQFNNRSEFDVVRSSVLQASNETPQLQLKLTTYSADLAFEHQLIPGLTGSAGMAYIRQSNVWQGRFLIPNYTSNAYGVFLLEKWSKGRIEIEAGLRWDRKEMDIFLNDNGQIRQIPYRFSNGCVTLGGTFKVNEHLQWRLNAGSTWRPPTVNELYSKGLHHGAAAIENGNATLVPEQALKVISALELSTKKTVAEWTIYDTYIHQFIYLKPDLQLVQTIRGAFPSYTYTQINARFRGTDLTVDHSLSTAWRLKGRASLVFAKNLSDNTFLIQTPPLGYGVTLQHLFQTPVLKKHEVFLSATGSRVEKQIRVPEQSDYALPPAGYTLLDLETGASFKAGKQTISLSFQVNNLFNLRYRDYMNRFRYFTDEAGRNFTLRIKIPFTLYAPETH